jgi:hypothetical protein
MIPLTKYLWKIGYTKSIGATTTIVTVIRMEVAVAACAKDAAMDEALVELLTSALSELAWFMY